MLVLCNEDVIEGRTNFVCQPWDPDSLAESIERYFSSDLDRRLGSHHREIADFAAFRYSLERVAVSRRDVYET